MLFKNWVMLCVVIFTSFQAYGRSCTDTFATALNFEGLKYPEKLRINGDLRAMLEGKNGDLVRAIGEALASLESPENLKLLRYGLRNHTFGSESGKHKLNQEQYWGELNRLLGDRKLIDADLKMAFESYKALSSKMTEVLSQDGLVVVSYLMSPFVKKANFTINYEIKSIDDAIDGVYRMTSKMSRLILDKEARQVYTTLLLDPGFREFFRPNLINFERGGSIGQSLGAVPDGPTLRFFDRMESGKVKLERTRQSQEMMMKTTIVIMEAVALEATEQGINIDGAVGFIHLIEQGLFRTMDDTSSVERAIDYFELVLSDTPVPFPQSVLVRQLETEVGRLLAPIRDQARDLPPVHSKKISAPATTGLFSFQPVESVSLFKRKNLPSGRKRKHKRQRVESERVTTNKVQSSKPSQELLTPGLVLEASKEYSFVMLRFPEMGEHKIRFTDEVIDFFTTDSLTSVEPFLRAIVYGYTARDGSNGIKKLQQAGQGRSIYEAKPGVSKYRLLLEKTEQGWTAYSVVHKDKVVLMVQ